MCCYNYNVKMVDLISKAIRDAPFRERSLAFPMGMAQLFGFSEADLKELAKYDVRKLRAMVEGPRPRS